MKLTLRAGTFLDDWWLIERAEHDSRVWVEPTKYGTALMCSSRVCDADIEGSPGEMLEIADAIERRGEFHARRCAVHVRGADVHFWSPRNSMKHGVVNLEEADELVTVIRSVLK